MKTKHIITLVVLFSFFSLIKTSAQDTLYVDSFDSLSTFSWSTLTEGPAWSWGTSSVFNGDTISIMSASGGGAAILVAETDSTANSILSKIVGVPVGDRVFLRFNQYLKVSSGNDLPFVIVKSINAVDTFQLNVNGIVNGTSSLYDVQSIDITSITKEADSVEIKFVMIANFATWIIDDVLVYHGLPEIEPISRIGDSLSTYGIPYDLDPTNWPYVPHQVVVQFYPSTPDFTKDTIRENMGFAKIGSCCSGEIELWTEESGGSDIPINELTKGDDGDDDDGAGVQDIEVNKYNFNHLQNLPPEPWVTLGSLPSDITKTDDDAIVIAVLDTGIDYEHGDLIPYIWQSSLVDTCYENDFIGWNFVNDNNNPDDDHSHGTHVAGIIVDNMIAAGIPECGFRIMPLKTHNSNGTANLFNATCATYYAINHGANVINDSWGFYGTSSKILKRAMEVADSVDVLIVTSSGNDGIALDNTPSFPACDNIDNIVTVGSHNRMDANGLYHVSAFSNYSATQVDILALGDSVLSAVPGLNRKQGRKTGTSMASPAVAAILAREYCKNGISYKEIKKCIFQRALKDTTLNTKSMQGRILVVKSNSDDSGCGGSFYHWCHKNWLLLTCFIVILFLTLFWFFKKK